MRSWTVRTICMLLFLVSLATISAQVDEYVSPERVRLLPVFLVSQGQKSPTQEQKSRLMRHVQWAQEWFRKNLDNRDTFEVTQSAPDVVHLKHPIDFYSGLKKGEAACHWVSELLDHYRVSRFKCSRIFCSVIMNESEDWPRGGGRTINGGINRGGGFLQMSSFALDRVPNFQSTLRHEIGHACGLTHVDVYGYDMKHTPSMMAYNEAYKTNGFNESRRPGRFIPEDIRCLALNTQVFPELKFDATKDIPNGYSLHPRVVTLGPMELLGHPDYEPGLCIGL